MSCSEMARQELEAGVQDKGPGLYQYETRSFKPGSVIMVDNAPSWQDQLPAVGDLQSQAKGTGARFNAGKAPVELLLWRYVAQRYLDTAGDGEPAAVAMHYLALYQETHDPAHLDGVVGALYSLSHDNEDTQDLDTARVFGYGAKKYAAWNWAKGMPWSVPVGCIGRHLLAILWGEVNDPESGLPHAGHVGCNVMMLQHYARHYKEGNDLPPKELFT